jgi:glutaminyl-peptide cyclotransferase
MRTRGLVTSSLLLVGLVAAACIASGASRGSPGAARAAPAPKPRVNRFNERRAFAFLARQVALGPRPAGSPASRRLAEIIRARLPRGRYQAVPGGLRNVIGEVRGRSPRRVVVVGAHYDTPELPGVVGANDGASGVAAVLEIAASLKPRQLRPTVVFILFDGEERPPGAGGPFDEVALRGSRVAAPRFRNAEGMILLDMVGDKDLSIPREGLSDVHLWRRLRAAAARVGVASVFPAAAGPAIADDHVPFL